MAGLYANRRTGRLVHDLAVEYRHFTTKILDVTGCDRVEVAVPDGDISVFSHFHRSNSIFQKKLPRRPSRIRPKRGVDVDAFRRTEGMRAINSLQSFADNGRPQPIASSQWRHEII